MVSASVLEKRRQTRPSDVDREQRQGLPELVFGKSYEFTPTGQEVVCCGVVARAALDPVKYLLVDASTDPNSSENVRGIPIFTVDQRDLILRRRRIAASSYSTGRTQYSLDVSNICGAMEVYKGLRKRRSFEG